LDAPAAKKAKSLVELEHDKNMSDIGDKKIDQPVRGFANEDTNMMPEPYPREEHSINGVDNAKF
jgi:hypothetical protein